MAVEDVEKTAFLTPCGVYCYTCMPFGLRLARFDHYVINVSLCVSGELPPQSDVHQPLKGCAHVTQSEGHASVAVLSAF